jgi:hypothetical protein
VAPQLAAFVSSLGLTTRFVVATTHDSAATLRAACSGKRWSGLHPGLSLDAASQGGGVMPGRLTVAGNESFDDLLIPAAGDGSSAGDLEDAVLRPLNNNSEGPELASSAAHLVPGVDGIGHDATPKVAKAKHAEPDLTVVLAVLDAKKPSMNGLPVTTVTVLAMAPGVGSREDLARLAVAVDDAGRRIDGVVVADPDPADRTTGRRTLEERARQAPLPLRLTGVGQPVSFGKRG